MTCPVVSACPVFSCLVKLLKFLSLRPLQQIRRSIRLIESKGKEITLSSLYSREYD